MNLMITIQGDVAVVDVNPPSEQPDLGGGGGGMDEPETSLISKPEKASKKGKGSKKKKKRKGKGERESERERERERERESYKVDPLQMKELSRLPMVNRIQRKMETMMGLWSSMKMISSCLKTAKWMKMSL